MIITSRCRFFNALPPKKRENFFGVSTGASPLDFGLCGAGVEVTMRLPSLRMRSLFRVKTGDHSMSS